MQDSGFEKINLNIGKVWQTTISKILRKAMSNSFIWFLMAAFLFALMVQNFIETKFAKVSFSYQLEHLVNLQLLQPEESHKIALNDNLVTFSGKFRDRLTDERKNKL